MAYAIITDSASNLNRELLEKYNLDMVTFHYQLDDRLIPCYEPDRDYNAEAKSFYDALRNGKWIKTSLISPQEYIDCFRKHLDVGEDIIYISISSKLSGTYNSACNARDILKDEYPERKIVCIDSWSASFGEALIVIYASEFRDQGLSLEETVEKISSMRLNVRNEFTVDNLLYLRRSGRVSALIYSIGALLDIKPMLRASREATIESCGKVHGRKKALMTLVRSVKEHIIDPEKQTIFIAHCDVEEEANKVAEMIRETVPVKDVYVHVYDLCTGAHVGPGTIAIFYYGQERD